MKSQGKQFYKYNYKVTYVELPHLCTYKMKIFPMKIQRQNEENGELNKQFM